MAFEQRFWEGLQALHPRHLLHSNDHIETCKLKRAENSEAALVTRACVNASNDSIVPPLGRPAACIPTNLPICMGLLTSRGIGGQIFWQWINQTYNCVFNHFQASKAVPFSSRRLVDAFGGKDAPKTIDAIRDLIVQERETLTTYAFACAASIGLSVGLTRSVSRLAVSASKKRALGLFVPYAAVAGASASNAILMRMPEMQSGIPIYGSDGECLGVSKEAAGRSAALAAASRAAMSFPILALPPPIMALMNCSQAIRGNPALRVGAASTVVSLGLLCGVPLGMALFPQRVSMRDRAGQRTVEFNRGI